MLYPSAPYLPFQLPWVPTSVPRNAAELAGPAEFGVADFAVIDAGVSDAGAALVAAASDSRRVPEFEAAPCPPVGHGGGVGEQEERLHRGVLPRSPSAGR